MNEIDRHKHHDNIAISNPYLNIQISHRCNRLNAEGLTILFMRCNKELALQMFRQQLQ
jgi:hypothetical protein